MPPQPSVVADVPCWIGEGALAHPDEGTVYWVDIPSGSLYRYDPAADEHDLCHTDPPIGGFTFQDDGSVLLFGAGGRITVWDDGAADTVVDGLAEEDGLRFNDVVADPRGRVFVGSMTDDDHGVGHLSRLETDGTLTRLEDGVELPNGMGFSPDEETFYLVETNTNTIYAYDYEVETGDLSNRRVFASADEAWAYDGLTVDADGGVWVGLWGGHAIVRLTPEGDLDEWVDVPAANVTTLSFGGEDSRRAYVTSATFEAPLTNALAGRLFAFDLEYEGKPEYYSRVEY
ncbi:SMP-30/gluconolactonase/LRE family protein [Natronobiforma cellulositropha]|uniref:SMP-30/gluconolactonase/LRE family protein n=1 Tax=Natronobiforma cellulositropha TaxID=1679076 RepID=UPI0021D5BB73|nr:SMP-30/gluconolactonase/LRE family protein [Natronobiforma cellulositropha]